jgi:outer membrane receptor protein involved in Fe transport
VSETRPLFGQSAHVANLSLLYQGSQNGLSAQLAFSYTGERIYSVSRYVENDLWQKGFFQLDFSTEKRFKKGLSVFVKAQNLLNTPVEVYIKKTNPQNNNLPYHSESDKTTLVRSEYTMQTYLAGIRYKFN